MGNRQIYEIPVGCFTQQKADWATPSSSKPFWVFLTSYKRENAKWHHYNAVYLDISLYTQWSGTDHIYLHIFNHCFYISIICTIIKDLNNYCSSLNNTKLKSLNHKNTTNLCHRGSCSWCIQCKLKPFTYA